MNVARLYIRSERKEGLIEFLENGHDIYDLLDEIEDWEDNLLEIIESNDLDSLILIIKNNLYRENPPSGTSILAMICEIRPELIEMAVDNGVDINMNRGDALLDSIVRNDFKTAKKLIELGAKLDVDDSNIINWALNNNSKEAAIFLSENGIDFSKSGIDVENMDDMSKSEYLTWASEYDSFQDAVTSLFGNVTPNLIKRIFKKVYEIEGQPNTKLINFYKFMKDLRPDIERDDLINVMPKKWNFDYRSAPMEELRDVLKYYNDKRVESLIQNEMTERHYIVDGARSLQKVIEALNDDGSRLISDEEIKENLPSKPKSFKEIHDATIILTRKIKQSNFRLNQDNLSHIEGEKIKDLTVWIPTHNHDLIEVGNSMNICVGNGWYADRVRDKEINVIILQKDGKNHVCIELNRGRIAQSKMHSNKAFKDGEVKSQLLELINGEKNV